MRGSSYRSTISQGKTVDTEDNARGKCKALLGTSHSTTTRIETSDSDSDSTEDDSSSSSEETPPKAIYPLLVAKSRKAQTQSTIDPTQLTRSMSSLAINHTHVPDDIIEISD